MSRQWTPGGGWARDVRRRQRKPDGSSICSARRPSAESALPSVPRLTGCSFSVPCSAADLSTGPSHADGMSSEGARWAIGPFGLDAGRAATYSPERTVLAVVHHMTAASRLADVIPLLERDRRIQVIYACPPTSMFPGAAED